MKIHVLTEDETTAGQGLNAPLRRNRKALLEREIDLEFFPGDPADPRLAECDCLFVNSKVFRSWWDHRKEDMLALFEGWRGKIAKVCYFDTTDSSGTLQSELLPYLDGYMKSFLLRDRRGYLEAFYGGRIFTDFYHRRFGVRDKVEIVPELVRPPRREDLGKLGVSWNSALSFGSGWRYRIRNLFEDGWTAPSRPRTIGITCRMSVNHKRETIRFQRERIAALAGEFGGKADKVPRKQYFRELREARIAVSPFGWGEFSYRDFEVFKRGCLLLKPDVSHLETWPDLYRKGETYEAFSWDFQDFREIVAGLLSDPARAEAVAARGQEKYRWFVGSKAARESFCDHVAGMVQGLGASTPALPAEVV